MSLTVDEASQRLPNVARNRSSDQMSLLLDQLHQIKTQALTTAQIPVTIHQRA